MYKILFGAILVIFSHPVLAQGDASRAEGLVVACGACHGSDGNSPAGAFPNIGGQHYNYLLKQLNDIKSGARPVAVMAGQLDNMSEQDLEDIAAFYAGQPIARGAADPEKVELGETIYRAGIARKNVAACTACHMPNGKGNNAAKFPVLSGQWPEYTVSQLNMFRSGERKNDGDSRMMRTVAMDLSDEEIAAVASYIRGLQ
ncbi:MAG: c-type cytochrome [Pseudomonadota bacterium]